MSELDNNEISFEIQNHVLLKFRCIGVKWPCRNSINKLKLNFNILLADDEQETEENDQARKLNLQGVQAAETGKLDEAITIFSEAIEEAPEHASSYNNRAQAYRLQGRIPGSTELII